MAECNDFRNDFRCRRNNIQYLFSALLIPVPGPQSQDDSIQPNNPDPPDKRILYNIYFISYKKMSDWHSNAKSVLVIAVLLDCGDGLGDRPVAVIRLFKPI